MIDRLGGWRLEMTEGAGISQLVYLGNNCVVDRQTRSIMRYQKVIRLTDIEYRILECLIEYAGQIVSFKTIIEYVWVDHYTGTRENLNVHIMRLRKRVEDNHRSPKLIVTVRGIGYILVLQGYRVV